MEKSELKTGMTVKTNSGILWRVIKGVETDCYGLQDIIVMIGSDNGFMCLGDYNDDLTKTSADSAYSICNVYDKTRDQEILRSITGEKIWNRRDDKPIVKLDGIEYSESTLRSIIKKATE